MSTSIIYNGLSAAGYNYLRTARRKGKIFIHIYIKHMGIDEIAVKKDYKHITVGVDPDTGQDIWVAVERAVSLLEAFLNKFMNNLD